MKKQRFILICLVLWGVSSVYAQSTEAQSEQGNSLSYYGEKITEEGAVSVQDLEKGVKRNSTSEMVKVTGDITAACQVKGCWMTLDNGESPDIHVTFKDYGFFVPTDAAGKTAIVEGVAAMDTISVDVLRHYAVDGGMSEEEAEEKITEPEVSLSLIATGVIIK